MVHASKKFQFSIVLTGIMSFLFLILNILKYNNFNKEMYNFEILLPICNILK